MSKKDLHEVVDIPPDTNIEYMSPEEVYSSRFKEYGLSTVLNRAIPDVVDGLLPVRRKILFTFNNANSTKPKKATYYIGNCMATVYVQGDASLYDSMVSMAQWFKMLNPLIKPTGAVGSLHNPTPAASRYLELSMDKFSKDVFFKDFDPKINPMKDNYDATIKEPITLPSIFPTIFNIGITGIGSGFTSEIPPHKVSDIIDITTTLLLNPDIDVKTLTKNFRPDFPSGGIITNENELPSIYEKGQGVIKCQATIEVGKYKNKDVLVVKDLPYKTYTENVLSQIVGLCKVDPKTKKEGPLVSLVSDVIDTSDKKNPVQLIIIPKRDASLTTIKNILLANTSLSTSIKYICNVLYNNELYVNASIKDVLLMWIENRIKFTRLKLNQEINNIARKIVVNKALIKAQANIDEIVKAIKTMKSKDDTIQYLANILDISKTEASYIAELRLYRLSNIESKKLEDENLQLEEKLNSLIEIVSEDEHIKLFIIDEMLEFGKAFKNEKRYTALANIDSNIDERDIVSSEDFICAISHDNVVYSRLVSEIKGFSNRNVKGTNLIDSRYKRSAKMVFKANTHDDLLCFTHNGLMMRVKAYDFLKNHQSIISVCNEFANRDIVAIIPIHKDETIEDKELVIITKNSYMKRVSLSECISNRTTLLVHKLNEGDKVSNVLLVEDNKKDTNIILSTNKGRIQINDLNAIKLMLRPTIGIKRFSLKDGEYITNSSITNDLNSLILLVTKNGEGKVISSDIVPERSKSVGAGSGFLGIKLKDNDSLDFIELVSNEDIENGELLLSTSNNKIIKIPSKTIPTRASRSSGGLSLANLEDNTYINYIAFNR